VLSSVLIVALLLGVYRSLSALALGLLPVVTGAVVGVAAVALGFGVVHGITLAFGGTLIGESVDYSIYLFIQYRSMRTLWPIIRLGVLTSIVGFASLLPSGFPGLAQLGLYSIAGLVAAALATRFVLPGWLPSQFAVRNVAPLGELMARTLRHTHALRSLVVIVPVLCVIVLYNHRGSLWNAELSALSPVSAQDQALDGLLRTAIGAPDARYLVVVSGNDQESVLRATETVGARLEELTDQGMIGGFDSPARYLPSLSAQRARQASLPAVTELDTRLRTALAGLPIRQERLQPFLRDIQSARQQPLVSRTDLEGTSMSTGVEALLINDGRHWSALLPLRAPGSFAIDVARVHSAILDAAPGEAVVLDIKHEADMLYSTYLSDVVQLSLAGFAGIIALLLWTLRSPLRVLRVVAPLAVAVLAVAAGLLALGRQLTILHVIGMLLIVAVGSNYALFFDRSANDSHPGAVPLTLASLVIANLATVVGFGVLATSPVPVLSALGESVAPGALLALVFSAILARDLPTATTDAVAN
jgi:predicted exporter